MRFADASKILKPQKSKKKDGSKSPVKGNIDTSVFLLNPEVKELSPVEKYQLQLEREIREKEGNNVYTSNLASINEYPNNLLSNSNVNSTMDSSTVMAEVTSSSKLNNNTPPISVTPNSDSHTSASSCSCNSIHSASSSNTTSRPKRVKALGGAVSFKSNHAIRKSPSYCSHCVVYAQKLKEEEKVESSDDTESSPEPEGSTKAWVASFTKRRNKKKSKNIEPERSSSDQRHTPDSSEYIKTSLHNVSSEEMGQNYNNNRTSYDRPRPPTPSDHSKLVKNKSPVERPYNTNSPEINSSNSLYSSERHTPSSCNSKSDHTPSGFSSRSPKVKKNNGGNENKEGCRKSRFALRGLFDIPNDGNVAKEVQNKHRVSYDTVGTRTTLIPNTRSSICNEHMTTRPTQSLDLPINGNRRNARSTTPLPDMTSNSGYMPFMPFQGFEAYAAKPKRQTKHSSKNAKSNQKVLNDLEINEIETMPSEITYKKKFQKIIASLFNNSN